MRKPYRLRLVHLFVLFTFSLFCLLFSCKKSEKELLPLTESNDLFFKQTTDADPAVQRIAVALQVQNKEEKISQKLLVNEGKPYWKNSIIKYFGKDTVVLIPMVLENTKFVHSYMAYYLNHNRPSQAILVNSQRYEGFGFGTGFSAHTIAVHFLLLNREVFGYTNYTISDKRIFELEKSVFQTGPVAIKIKASENVVIERSGNTAESENNIPVSLASMLPCQPTTMYVSGCGDPYKKPSDYCTTYEPVLGPCSPTLPADPGIIGGGNGGGGSSSGPSLPPLPTNSCPSYYTQQQCADISMPVVMPYDQPQINSSLIEIIPDEDVLGNFIDDPNRFADDPTPITFNLNQDPWPTITSVIPVSDFVKYDYRNCLTLAKEQISKKGVNDLGYASAFKIYSSLGGPYPSIAIAGVEYIITKLQSQKPVIVGIDNRPGTPSTVNADGKTDHFVTIVGSGQDINGKFFLFYDNATNIESKGTSLSNKLYFNETSGIISGRSAVPYANAYSDYIVTQVRKNK